MTKKNKESDFNLNQSINDIEDWDWKKEAFKRYITGLNVEIKSEKELEKQYNDYYGGKIE